MYRILVFLALLHPFLGNAQGFDRTFYPEEFRQDLALLRTTITEAHADPYRYLSPSELGRLFDRADSGLASTTSLLAFMDTVNRLLRALGDAHTLCSPPREVLERAKYDVPLLPVELAVTDSALYVKGERMGFRRIAPGSRILSIDGRPADRIIGDLLPFISADGHSRTTPYRLLEKEFAVRFGLRYGFPAEHKLVIKTPSGVREEVVMRALTADEMAIAEANQNVLLPWRATLHEDRSVMWVELTTMDQADLDAADLRPERFLGDLLRDLEKNQVENLVLDLRGASGSDLGMAEQVFALVARQPFKVVRRMAVRSVTVPTWYRRAVPVDDFYAAVGDKFSLQESGLYVLPPEDDRMKELPHAHRRFEGKVYVIQDGLTSEAAAAVGMLVKRADRGRLIGEESGTNAVSFCGGRELRITAPRTGVQFVVPLIRYTFEGSANGPSDRGELPDIPLDPSPKALPRGEDGVRKAVLLIIDELR